MEICHNFSTYIQSGLTTDIPNLVNIWGPILDTVLNY